MPLCRCTAPGAFVSAFCNQPWLLFPSASPTVKPLGDRIFIKVSASEETTAGGILLPDTAKEKPQVGEVVQVGPGKRNDDGSRQAPEVGVGDKVLYSKYAGTDIKLGSDEYCSAVREGHPGCQLDASSTDAPTAESSPVAPTLSPPASGPKPKTFH